MPNHHDRGYKELFSHPEFVQQLLTGFAPPELASHLDFSTLALQSGNYITPLANEKFEDLVWSVKLLPDDDSPPITIYLYLLLEFQSRVDATMPLRMLHYVASFYHQLLKQEKIHLRKQKLPPVFPLVLYNGRPVWYPPLDMHDLIQPVPSFLRKYQPSLRYFLVDEHRLGDDLLAASPEPLSGVFSLEKLAVSGDFRAVFEQLLRKVRAHPDHERIGQALTRWIVYYVRTRNVPNNLNGTEQLEEIPAMFNFKRELEESRQQGMNLGKLEGLEEGTVRGKQETARNLLELGLLSEEQIAQVTGLPLSQIREIRAERPH